MAKHTQEELLAAKDAHDKARLERGEVSTMVNLLVDEGIVTEDKLPDNLKKLVK